MPLFIDLLLTESNPLQAKVRSAAEFAAKGMMKEKMAATATKYSEIIKKKTQVNWAIGDMDYEAYMRLLDSAV